MKTLFFLAVSVWFLILSNAAFAYIDPGSGSALLNTIWPLIVGVFTAIIAFLGKYFWKPIKNVFSKIFGKSN
jgi:uncharacterized BrkB/YihY/UPF0761 family membrane protein